MIPLPGSWAICSGLPSQLPADVTTDQRGLPNTNSNYPGYSAESPCVDSGAVQTNYSLAFSAQPAPASPATVIVPNIPFNAAVTLKESNKPFAPPVTIPPLTLTGAGIVNGGSATTASGVANYFVSISYPDTSDILTASLTLNPIIGPTPPALTASSSEFMVGQLTPNLNFAPSPASQVYGAGIGAGSLDATASYNGNRVPGTFAYATTVNGIQQTLNAGVTLLPVGGYTITATFTPTDTPTFLTVSTTATYSVTVATPMVSSWPTASAISYGQTLALSTLSGGTASAAGTFAFTAPTTAPAAGTALQSVGFTPQDLTDYNAPSNGSVSVKVNQATLTIKASSASRVFGTPNPAFSGSVSGAIGSDTFTENFAGGASIGSDVGTYAIVPSVTGTNLADYLQVITNGTLTVTQAGSSTSLSVNSGSVAPGQSVTLTARVTSDTTGTPSGTVDFYDNGSLLTAAVFTGTASYSTTALAPGVTHAITATYNGGTDFTASSTVSTVDVVVAPLDFTITTAGPSSQTVVTGGVATYKLAVAPMYGSYAEPVNIVASGLPPGATVDFSSQSIAPDGGPQTVTVTIHTAPATAMRQTPSPPNPARRLGSFALAFVLLIGVGGLRRRGQNLWRTISMVMLLVGTVAGASALAGCSSPNGFFAQAQQSYTITIKATSGAMQHSTTVTLNVE